MKSTINYFHRNVAAIGGNIMTGSPISDLNPILMAANCTLKIASIDKEYEVQLDDKFYSGYRRNIVQHDEILVSIKIPFTSQNQHFIGKILILHFDICIYNLKIISLSLQTVKKKE